MEFDKLSPDGLVEGGGELPRRSFERPGERIFRGQNDAGVSLDLHLRRVQDGGRWSSYPTVPRDFVMQMFEFRLSCFHCRRFV